MLSRVSAAPRRKVPRVTVCIAAICRHPNETPMVIGASDRMITVGDVQFEPYVTKVFPLTSSIFLLTAGESSVNAEIVSSTKQAVAARLKKDESWMLVEEAARLVGEQVQRYVMRIRDQEILGPMGLT